MKKLLFALVAVMAVTLFGACSKSGASTPTEVAEQAMKAAQDKNYDKVVDMMVDKNGNALSAEDSQQLKSLYKEKANSGMPAVKEFKVVNEEILADGNEAVVTCDVTYDDGKEKQTEIEMLKGADGKWHLTMGK